MLKNLVLTAEMVKSKNPCENWPIERLQEFYGEGKTLIEVLKSEDVSYSDRVWTATKFLFDKQNREFALWCARSRKSKIKAINDYIDVIEKYYEGKATQKELDEARSAADSDAYSAAYWAAYLAANQVADLAAYLAANQVADLAADWAAYWAAGWAAYLNARQKQINKLIEIITREV
jgi:hypothetical protein